MTNEGCRRACFSYDPPIVGQCNSYWIRSSKKGLEVKGHFDSAECGFLDLAQGKLHRKPVAQGKSRDVKIFKGTCIAKGLAHGARDLCKDKSISYDELESNGEKLKIEVYESCDETRRVVS